MEQQSYIPLVCMTMVRERELPYGAKEFSNPALVAELAGQILKDADREYLLVISVDAKSKPLAVEIILIHNHPSGDCEPGEADKRITEKIEKGGFLLGIEIYAHVIVGDGYYSFRENGRMKA